MQQYKTQWGGDTIVTDLLKHDIRPTAIISATAIMRGYQSEGEYLDITDTIYENKSFEVLIRNQCAIWTQETVKRILYAECPAEVIITDLGVRFRVLKLENIWGEERGITILDYNGTGTDGGEPSQPLEEKYLEMTPTLSSPAPATIEHRKAVRQMGLFDSPEAVSPTNTEHMQTDEIPNSLDPPTQALRDSELFFATIVNTTAVGLAITDVYGGLTFTNSAFHELATSVKKGNNKNYLTCVYHEDREHVNIIFNEAVARRCAAQWEARTGHDHPERGWKYWVSWNMVLQTGELGGYVLTLVDITQLKLAEESQRQSSEQAVTRRRQQEEFIDIFSHELRNLFNAELQCADDIRTGVKDYHTKGGNLDIAGISESTSTILMCVQNQITIINDVLTLSKLESNSMVLSVVPVDVQIHESVLRTLKLFQSELQTKGIKAVFIIEDSYTDIALDWLKCDPSRFNQILVNLVTNAIKFTSFRTERREITVTLSAYTASFKPPSIENSPDPDHDRSDDDDSVIAGKEWGSGEKVFVHVKVHDTGIGMSKHWQKKVFHRFEQVPHPGVNYGGSGLGLFICKILCQLQGGRIGVCSEEGKWSEFAFYIRARRCAAPPNAPEYCSPSRIQIICDRTAQGAPSETGNGTFTQQENEHAPAASQYDMSSPRHTDIPIRRMQSSLEVSTVGSAVCETLQSSKTASTQSVTPASENPYAYRVLIVEDNLVNQNVLRQLLCKRGYIAHVANNGQEGLNFIEESEFGQEGGPEVDVVLMDKEMPVMDGNMATRIIRQGEVEGRLRKHVPILGTSGNARNDHVAEMIRAGMDDIIMKPFGIEEIVAKLDQLVGRFGTRRAPSSHINGRVSLPHTSQAKWTNMIPDQLHIKFTA